MVYLAELLVVMADGLKTVRVLARNVHRVHGHKRLDDDASLSLSRCRKATHGVVFSMQGTVLLKQKKLVLGYPAHVWQWPLSKKVVVTVCPLHFETKSEQSYCNKCSVR